MRQIKFRAWDEKHNKMMMGWDLSLTLGGEISTNGVNYEYDEPHPNHIKLMQYTGLKDKNGKEIYEGDIVKIPDGRLHTIVWENWGFCIKDPKSGIYNALSEYLEIIGNIYENPELITS